MPKGRPKGTKNKKKVKAAKSLEEIPKLLENDEIVHLSKESVDNFVKSVNGDSDGAVPTGEVVNISGVDFDIVSKETPPEPKEEVTNVNNCEYHLTMNFNGEKFECFTNNLEVGILSFKPLIVLTEGYVKVQKGEAVFERRYPLIRMKQFFNDPETLQIFLANLQLG